MGSHPPKTKTLTNDDTPNHIKHSLQPLIGATTSPENKVEQNYYNTNIYINCMHDYKLNQTGSQEAQSPV
jgi:hypothetical protein